eukprot:COSAG02_NODE_2353_length_9081_cov_4.981073_3_plen_87_part_00
MQSVLENCTILLVPYGKGIHKHQTDTELQSRSELLWVALMLYINLGTVNAMYQYETTKSRSELQGVALKFNIHHTDSNAKQYTKPL